MQPRTPNNLGSLSRDELAAFVEENLFSLTEDEALEILDHSYVTPPICSRIAQNSRLTGFYSVRLKLVSLRQTPQAHAVKLVHYLFWFDLLRLSLDMQVPTPVRRAIETHLLNRADQLSLGERIASARRCGSALIKVFLADPDAQVFAALLTNSRMREDELVALASSAHASPDQLRVLAADPKWSYRYAIRKALVLNPNTPRASAASQLRYLSRADLKRIHSNPATSVYLRRCIERLAVNATPDRGPGPRAD